jgi:helicase
MHDKKSGIPAYVPDYLRAYFSRKQIHTLTPVQVKALDAGIYNGTSLLVCSPTASGKTLVATFAISQALKKGKAVYIVPLKALAHEKYQEYIELFNGTRYSVTVSVGDFDSPSHPLGTYDVIILTVEKLDSLIRHGCSWLPEVKTVIIDEMHLLNDLNRGPTLEVVITLLKQLIQPQFVALSATIGNPQELANWLGATLIVDHWRPVKLKHGIYHEGTIEFYDEKPR